jgi:hypothetical protein
MTVDADRLGESTGQAGFCFYSGHSPDRTVLWNQSFIKIEEELTHE